MVVALLWAWRVVLTGGWACGYVAWIVAARGCSSLHSQLARHTGVLHSWVPEQLLHKCTAHGLCVAVVQESL